MDYLVFSVMVNFAVLVFNLSYDIACQWNKKLWPRMASMPPRLRLDRENKLVRFFVPKFHLNAHVQSCQTAFSFNFGKNVGCTDGEAPERGWANINRVASSTKEMGPGARRDTLDDHFSDWNWKKVTMLGMFLTGLFHFESHVFKGRSLLRKVKEASRRSKLHREELNELQQSIPAPSLSVWKSEIESWEEENTQPNPFESRVIRKSFSLLICPKLTFSSYDSSCYSPPAGREGGCRLTGWCRCLVTRRHLSECPHCIRY